MRNILSMWNRRTVRKAAQVSRRWRCSFEQLEDRFAPAGNLLVTTAGSYPQQFFKEFTPSGSLVRTLTIPPPIGSSGDNLGSFYAIIQQILSDDEQAPPKQRHTFYRLFERRRDEHRYQGGYD